MSEAKKVCWHVGSLHASLVIYREDGYAVGDATTFHGKIDRQEAEANALLMASAPEMLALLKQLNDVFYVGGKASALREVMAKTKPLIRQAEGRPL